MKSRLRIGFYFFLILSFLTFVLMDLYVWLSNTSGPFRGGAYASLIQVPYLLEFFHGFLFVTAVSCAVALVDLTRQLRGGVP